MDVSTRNPGPTRQAFADESPDELSSEGEGAVAPRSPSPKRAKGSPLKQSQIKVGGVGFCWGVVGIEAAGWGRARGGLG